MISENLKFITSTTELGKKICPFNNLIRDSKLKNNVKFSHWNLRIKTYFERMLKYFIENFYNIFFFFIF